MRKSDFLDGFCFSLPHIGPICCVRLKCSVSPFSCFLRSSILSRLSQSAELRTEILSQGDWLHSARPCVCDCVLVFKCVHKGTTGCISKVMVTNPYLFFFFPFPPALCVSSAILEKCVWIHLCGGLLRCDAPYHRFLYIAYICLNNKNRFMKPAAAV